MGENAGWPNELADVRSNAARFKCGHHSGERFRRARRRLFPHLRVQQSRECGRGGAAFAEAVAALALPAAPEPLAKAGRGVCEDGDRAPWLQIESLLVRANAARNV